MRALGNNAGVVPSLDGKGEGTPSGADCREGCLDGDGAPEEGGRAVADGYAGANRRLALAKIGSDAGGRGLFHEGNDHGRGKDADAAAADVDG